MSTITKNIFDKLSNDSKCEYTSRIQMSKRGIIIQNFDDWYLAKNEWPVSGRTNQMILWRKHNPWLNVNIMSGSAELEEIMREYWLEGYTITAEPVNQNNSFRTHFHIYKS